MGNFIATVPEFEALNSFQNSYARIHCYLALVITVIGLLGNMASIVVLTRPTMLSSCHTILTGLAISDNLRRATFLLFLLYNVCLYPTLGNPAKMTYTNAVIDFTHIVVDWTLQSICVWITVVLAIIRIIAISSPLKAHIYCSHRRCILAMFACVAMVVVTLTIPSTFSMTIAEVPAVEYGFVEWNDTVWTLIVPFNTEEQILFQNMFSWILAILHLLIPCLLLAAFSGRLVYMIRRTNKRRSAMFSPSSVNHSTQSSSIRTTRMLVVVTVIFFLTEFPHSILAISCGLFDGFIRNIQEKLMDIIVLTSIINNGINFFVYCSMSKKFREMFLRVFCGRKTIMPNDNYE